MNRDSQLDSSPFFPNSFLNPFEAVQEEKWGICCFLRFPGIPPCPGASQYPQWWDTDAPRTPQIIQFSGFPQIIVYKIRREGDLKKKTFPAFSQHFPDFQGTFPLGKENQRTSKSLDTEGFSDIQNRWLWDSFPGQKCWIRNFPSPGCRAKGIKLTQIPYLWL